MKRYGVGYKGGKSKIVEHISKAIPFAEVFVDLFAGGCAMTHWAMETKRFTRFVANDMQGDGLRLFVAAVEGKFENETRWISRDDFVRLKDSEPYVSLCWSFGNNQRDYMYSKEIEPWKKALHYARVFGDFSLLKEFGIEGNGSRQDVSKNADEYKKKYIRWWLSRQNYSKEELDAHIAKCNGEIKANEEEYYKKMQSFMPALDKDYNEVIGLYKLWQSLERLEDLQSLQSLQSLERLQTSFTDYREVAIPRNSVVYCDPPYTNTSGYIANGDVWTGGGFDHSAFYDWCESQTELVLISEYFMPEDRFTAVWSKDKSCAYGHSGKATTECLFVPNRQLPKYHAMMAASHSCQLTIDFQ